MVAGSRVESAFQYEQIERRRLAAHQVVVDHERPDQVVLAHQVEHVRHVVALEIALLGDMLLDPGELLAVDEHGDLADLLEVEQRGEEGRGLDAILALGGEPGERRADQDAADAKAEHARLALARGLLDRIERRQRAVVHVVVKILVREVLARVDPGDHEHRQALVDAPFDQAVFRLQVEHVELVDPGRHDQQRPPVDLLGAGRVLDQLHQLVLEDHLAGRGGDVPADLERVRIGHA